MDRKLLEKINKASSLRKINKIDKPLGLIRKKRKEDTMHVLKG